MHWIFSPRSWGLLGAYLALLPSAHADISGKVFRDFNSNGVFDSSTSFNEIGLAGVSIKAFNAAGTQVGATASSGADGSYTLTGLSAAADYRVEFSWSSPWLYSSVAGGSSVQFVKDGASNVNFALANPAEYTSSADPYLAIPQFINGAYNATGTSSKAGLVVVPFSATSPDGSTQTPAPITKATAGQIGATWGVALQRSQQTLYTSAVIRRFAGLGPLGTGGIYKVDMSSASTAATGSLNYIDLASLGIPTGADPRDGSSCNSVATDVILPAHDILAAKQTAVSGIGGLSMDNEHERLWLVNMADRKLYALQNVNPTTTPKAADVLGGYAIALPTGFACTNGELRPWAVKYRQGQVYVGAVCDASTGLAADLAGYVLRFDPNNAVAGFAVEHKFNFTADRNTSGTAWAAWRSDELRQSPVLSAIEFDIDGSLMLGITDRFGLMIGPANYNSLDCADTTQNSFTSQGDILRFCKNGSSYLQDGVAGCSTVIPSTVKTHDEYYWGEHGPVSGTNANFNEAAAGGLAFIAGSNLLMSTGIDPKSTDQSGIYWLNNETGADVHRYFIYTSVIAGGPPPNMAKTAGVGDIEIISAASPVEVGNRVWKDTDADGIQDADELGIDNVDVVLSCGSNTATTQTANGGVYLFSNASNASFMQTGANCSISIVASQTALSGLSVTAQNQEGAMDNNAVTDIRDSDADSAGVISFTVGKAGENNHSLDFGYSTQPNPLPDLKLVKVVDKATAKRGDSISYSLTLTNESTTAATGVAVNDLLPSQTAYVSHSGDGAYDASTGIWTLGDVAGTSSKQLMITVTIK
ncbi:MAG: SdrD B-like domain-containing protein [Thiolinea sp.]